MEGRRPRKGTYLLTYRSLRGDRITSVSNSIRVRIGADGRIRHARRQR